jgi:hypothetical protein
MTKSFFEGGEYHEFMFLSFSFSPRYRRVDGILVA